MGDDLRGFGHGVDWPYVPVAGSNPRSNARDGVVSSVRRARERAA